MAMKIISVTDIGDFKLGNAEDSEKGTGCTVVICEKGAVGGVDVRGGGPATRETDLLRSENTVNAVNAVVLSGGSAFGLEAASGVMRELSERKIGFDVGDDIVVPIVCGASLYDLPVGDPKAFPDVSMGIRAVENAYEGVFSNGNHGAGTGATVGKLKGYERAMKTGLGTFACGDGVVEVGAIAAVNAVGDIYNGAGNIVAGLRSKDGKSIYGTIKTLKGMVHDGIKPVEEKSTAFINKADISNIKEALAAAARQFEEEKAAAHEQAAELPEEEIIDVPEAELPEEIPEEPVAEISEEPEAVETKEVFEEISEETAPEEQPEETAAEVTEAAEAQEETQEPVEEYVAEPEEETPEEPEIIEAEEVFEESPEETVPEEQPEEIAEAPVAETVGETAEEPVEEYFEEPVEEVPEEPEIIETEEVFEESPEETVPEEQPVEIAEEPVEETVGETDEEPVVETAEETVEEVVEEPVALTREEMGYDIVFNTTISCLITNAELTKSQANKLASILHDAYARAIKPVHGTLDGDTVFVLATGEQKVNFDAFAALATDVMQYAIIDGAMSAEGAFGLPAAVDMQ